MVDTVREQIIQGIVSRCDALTTYPVLRSIRHYLNEDSPEARRISVWDGPEGESPGEYFVTVMAMTVVVRITEGGLNPSSVINNALGSTIAAVLGTDVTLGGLCREIRYVGAAPDYSEEQSRIAVVNASFLVTYGFAQNDPYTVAN